MILERNKFVIYMYMCLIYRHMYTYIDLVFVYRTLGWYKGTYAAKK